MSTFVAASPGSSAAAPLRGKPISPRTWRRTLRPHLLALPCKVPLAILLPAWSLVQRRFCLAGAHVHDLPSICESTFASSRHRCQQDRFSSDVTCRSPCPSDQTHTGLCVRTTCQDAAIHLQALSAPSRRLPKGSPAAPACLFPTGASPRPARTSARRADPHAWPRRSLRTRLLSITACATSRPKLHTERATL